MEITLNAADYFGVAVAQGNDKHRAYINCVRIEKIAEDSVRLIATNGHFLFTLVAQDVEMSPDWPVGVSVKIDKKLAGGKLTINLATGVASTDKGETLVEKVDLDFPTWQRVVPQGPLPVLDGQICADTEYLVKVAKFLQMRTVKSPTFYGHGFDCPMVALGDATAPNRLAVLMPIRKGDYAESINVTL